MTSTEAELGLDDDLNLGPNVSLLDFGKLVEGIEDRPSKNLFDGELLGGFFRRFLP